MTHIEKNYGPIVLGDYIAHQENYIDKQLNVVGEQLAGTAQAEERQPDAAAEELYHMDERAKRIFALAEQDGLLSRVKDGYAWHENNTLLDYFLGRTFCYDYPAPDVTPGTRPAWLFDDELRLAMPVQEMNRLFGCSGIGNIRRARHMQPVPKGYQRIDAIVEKC